MWWISDASNIGRIFAKAETDQLAGASLVLFTKSTANISKRADSMGLMARWFRAKDSEPPLPLSEPGVSRTFMNSR